MQGTIQNYTLNMADGTALKPLIVKQGDTNSRFARISLVAFKEPWTIPFGCQIHINVRKNDGTYANATCTQEDEHTALAPITEQMTAVPGTQLGELFFLGADGDIRSQTFPLVVWDAVSDLDRMVSSDDFQALKEALRDIKASTEIADIAAQYAAEQGNSARDGAQRANDAADSIQAAVDAAAAAKVSETNAKTSETAAAQTQQEVTDYVEAQKAAFVGYSQRESDSKYANALTETATGEGGITVEDAWTAPVLGLDVAGKSEQVQTMGKNLFDTDTYVTFMLSKNDANNTVNKKVFDGRECLYINGSLVSTETVLFSCSPELVYTISYDVYVIKTTGTASGNGFAFARENEANLNALPRYTDVGKWTKITLVTTTGCLYVYPTYGSRSEQYIDINSIQIEVGNIVTEYEPYTGGAPSPSPDYPQDIISTGTVTTGAQMLDSSLYSLGTFNGVTFANDAQGRVVLNGTATAVTQFFLGDYINMLTDGKTYCLSNVSNSNFAITENELTKYSKVVTVNKSTMTRIKAYIQIDSGTVCTNKIYAPMLNAGDTALPWEPYTGGKPSPSVEYPQEMKVGVTGANLFDADKVTSMTAGGATVTNNGDGSFTVSGSGALTNKINRSILFTRDQTLTILRAGNYCMSGAKTYPYFHFTLYNTVEKNVVFEINTKNTPSKEITQKLLNNENLVLRIGFYGAAGESIIPGIVRPMVNAGDQPLPWEPYKGHQTATITLTEPLRGIGEYRDRIMCRDGVWGIERWIKEIELDGSADESWSGYDLSTVPNRYHIAIDNAAHTATSVIMANKLTGKVSGTGTTYTDLNVTWLQSATITLRLYVNYLADNVGSFRNKLQADPITVIYPLATPTWTPLPDATQQALNALTTYAGTTHLTITAGGPAPTVTLDYVQDTHKALEQCQEAAKEYTDTQIAAIVAALPTATQAAIVDNQTTRLLQEA